MRTRWLAGIAVTLLSAALVPARVLACECPRIDPLDALSDERRWPVVVRGEVGAIVRLRRRPGGMLYERAEVRVLAKLRGPQAERIVVYRLVAEPCPVISLEVGRRYLLFLRPDRYRYADRHPERSSEPRFALVGCNPSALWQGDRPWELRFDATVGPM